MSELQFDSLLELKASGAITANGNGSGVLAGPQARGKVKCVIHITAKSGTSPTIDFKLQESDDNSTFTDIAHSRFDQINDVGVYKQEFSTTKKYVRLAWTVGGTTPSFTTWAYIDKAP
jgi:hypothetical protein